MIVSFEVGAAFTIQDDGASATIAHLAEGMTMLAERTEGVQQAIGEIGRISLARLTRQIDGLAEASEKSLPIITSNMAELRAAMTETEVVAARLAESLGMIRGGGGGGRGGGGGGGGGGGSEGGFSERDGWNEASRAAYPNARYWDGDFNQVERRMRGAADYENRDNDLQWRAMRTGADSENRDRDLATRQTRGDADYENRDRDLAGRQMRGEADYENADNDRAYRQMRSGAEGENRDNDARYRNAYTMAQREEADRDLQYRSMRSAAEYENDDWNRRYDYNRRMAEYENEEFNRRNRPPPAPAGGGGGGGGSGGAGGHGVLSGMGQLIEAASLYGAFHSALSEQQSLFLGAQAFGADPTQPEGQDIMNILRHSAAGAAVGTSFSESQTAGGIPLLARPFGLEGVQGAQQFSQIYAGAARSAEAIDLMRLGKFDDSLQAAIEFAHETRTYDPEGFQHQMDVLGAITSLTPHTTFGAEARTMSYIIPMARTAGIDPEEAAIATGFLQQGGLRGTVAGTTLRQMLVGLTRTGGPMNAHQQNASRAFSRGMNLEPGERQHFNQAIGGNAHVRAMHEVGYLDQQGHETFLDEHGNIDLEKAFSIFGQYAQSHTAAQNMAEAYNLFGVRGQGAVEIISGATENYERYRERIHGMTGDQNRPFLATQRDELSQSGWQEFGQAWKRVQDIGNHLADSTLPGLQGVLEHGVIPGLNALAHMTSPDADGHYSTGQQAAGYGLGAAAAAGSAYGLRALWGRLFGGAAAGAGEAAAGAGAGEVAATGLTVGTLSVGSILFGAGALAALGAGIYAAWKGATSPQTDTPHQALGDHNLPWGMDQGHTLGALPGGASDSEHRALVAYRQRHPVGPVATQSEAFMLRAHQEQYAPLPGAANSRPISFSFPSITLNGVGADTEKMVRSLFTELAHKLTDALSHSAGTGDGSYMSPMIGAGLP